MADVLIRPAESADYDQVIGQIDEWWGGRAMAGKLPRLFFTHFRPTSFVAERDGEIVGFLCGFVSATDLETAYAHFVGVAPTARGEGLGERLYEHFFAAARRHGRSIVRCVTSPVNTGSLAFHARLGFDSTTVGDYDGRGGDRVVFTRRIDDAKTPAGPAPVGDIRGMRAAHALLVRDLESCDFTATAPSLLPGWTAGHVITHLARNADSVTGMFEAAARGGVGDQYPGGLEQRSSDIESGANRSPAALVHDVSAACARLDAACAQATDEVWTAGQGRSAMLGEMPLVSWPFRRWREVEIHHSDLGLGFTPHDWSVGFVAREWPNAVDTLADRLGRSGGVELAPTDAETQRVGTGIPTLRARQRELLAWILGRAEVEGAPTLAPYAGQLGGRGRTW